MNNLGVQINTADGAYSAQSTFRARYDNTYYTNRNIIE